MGKSRSDGLLRKSDQFRTSFRCHRVGGSGRGGGRWLSLLGRRSDAQGNVWGGVTYGCERLAPGRQGKGLVYWVRVDLTAPGIEVYVTPKDPTAVSLGWQYRLRRIRDVVDKEDLAVAING